MKIILTSCVGVDSEGHFISHNPGRWTRAAESSLEVTTYYPRELAYLAAYLKRATSYSVRLIDGCFNQYSKQQYLDILLRENPDWLVMESSPLTSADDLWVATKLKAYAGTRVIMVGQYPSAYPAQVATHVDAVIQGEYILPVANIFRHKKLSASNTIITNSPGNVINVHMLPFPEDVDISRNEYTRKGDPVCQYKEIPVYASRGCPYQCMYCVHAQCFCYRPLWQSRTIDNILAEMRYLFLKYPDCKGLTFDDEIHNSNRKFNRKLAGAIIKAGLENYKYSARYAYHLFDESTLTMMKSAGYYLLKTGIITASSSTAETLKLGKKYNPGKLVRFLETAGKTGMYVHGSFMIGIPGSTPYDDMKTIELMQQLLSSNLLYDCSVSMYTPQPGTPLHDYVVRNNLLKEHKQTVTGSFSNSHVSTAIYPADELMDVNRKASELYSMAMNNRLNQCETMA